MPYDNEKKFVLFSNDKGNNPKRPDYRGKLTIEGVEWEMSAWIKTDKHGETFMGGEITLKEERKPSPAPARRQEEKGGDFSADDDPPF